MDARAAGPVLCRYQDVLPDARSPGLNGVSAQNVIQECEASLRRLNTDYIDLFQLHHPSNHIPIDETLRALDRLVHTGKIRYIGTSSFAAWQLVEALWGASNAHLTPPSSEQPVYNLLDRRVERELLPMARTYGIGVLTWSPLAGGVLANRYQRGEQPAMGSRHEAFWKGRHEAMSDGVFDAVDELDEIAAQAGVELPHLAYRWLLHQPGLTSIITGPRTTAHLEAGLKAADGTLDTDVIDAIDAVARPGGVVLPQYCHDGLAWEPWGPNTNAWR
jgi:aryl-alcohol dehydrogenase-like predicted oxidoreductase